MRTLFKIIGITLLIIILTFVSVAFVFVFAASVSTVLNGEFASNPVIYTGSVLLLVATYFLIRHE